MRKTTILFFKKCHREKYMFNKEFAPLRASEIENIKHIIENNKLIDTYNSISQK